MEDKKIYVLDTSALLALIENEDGAEFVDNFLHKAEKREVLIYISFISLTEIYYISIQEKSETEANERIELITSLALMVTESNKDINLRAGKLKAKNKISLADAYIAALCFELNGILVHKDPEYEKIITRDNEYRLPYK